MLDLIQDFRYGIRQIRRSPGFFITSALLIAIGIAATTEVFTLIDAFLLRPLPVRDPENLVQLFEQQAKRPADPLFFYGFYQDLSRNSSTLFAVGGQSDTTRALEQNGQQERAHIDAVTENFFTDLGVTPLLGRILEAGDHHVVVLSYDCWSKTFARDRGVLGQQVRVQGHPYTVVGITQPGFTGTTLDSSPDLWIPFSDQLEFGRTPEPNLDRYAVEIIARLRPGISERQAQLETAALWGRYLQEKLPGSNGFLDRGELQVQSIAHGTSPIRSQSKTALTMLLAGTGLVMMMVCANVGGLLLFRATARERETAIRVALGATRARIMRRWLIESFLLTAVGGVAGVLLAYASVPVLMKWMPPAHGIGFDPGEIRTLAIQISPDLRVLAFSLVICAITTLLCTLAPAWLSWRADINATLKSMAGDRRTRLFQSALCGAQIALCTTLLLSAGLIIRSLSNLRSSDAGFDRQHVTIFSIDPRIAGYDSQRTWSVEQRLLSGARNIPGVEGAALAYRALMRGIGLGTSVVFPGQRGGIINTSMNSVTPDYFGVMGIPLLAGQNFRESEGKLTGVIVNQAFVRKFLAGREPLGETFATGQRFERPRYQIIGVVGDTKYRSLREVPPPIMYTDDFGPKGYPDTFILHVKSSGDPRAVIAPVRELVRSIDPGLPLYQVATLSEEVDRSLWQERLVAVLTSCFGAFALSLAAIGLYGVLAYFVAQRQQEIALRIAVGAEQRHVIWLVLSRVVPILAIGVAAGAVISLLAGKWVRSLLYGVGPSDPVTNVAVGVLLITIAAAGAALPAFRAVRVDPAAALRQD